MKEFSVSLRGATALMRTIPICAVVLMTAVAPVLAQKPSAPATVGADQFSSEQAAKGHCPGDTIVWANLAGSKAYHTSGNRYYGKTKHGAFMCQKDADQSGFHPAGSRAHRTATKSTAPKTTQ